MFGICCKFIKEEIARQNAVLKRLAQSGSAQAQNLTYVQGNVEVAKQELRTHKEEASAARDYYNDITQRCTAEWAEIMQISQEENPSPKTLHKLAVAQHKFTLVLSDD